MSFKFLVKNIHLVTQSLYAGQKETLIRYILYIEPYTEKKNIEGVRPNIVPPNLELSLFLGGEFKNCLPAPGEIAQKLQYLWPGEGIHTAHKLHC